MKLRPVGFALLVFLLLGLASPVLTPATLAQRLTCDDFAVQEAAQAVVDANPDDEDLIADLDDDEDGVACEDLPSRDDAGSTGADKLKLPDADPSETPDIDDPTPEPDDEPTPEPDDEPNGGDVDPEIFGYGLGATRNVFEDEFGTASDRGNAGDYDVGDIYIGIRGYQEIRVFYADDIVVRIQLLATEPIMDPETATDMQREYLPDDFEESGPELSTDGYTQITGASDAIANTIDAGVYDEFEVGGEPGELRIIQVLSGADVAIIDIGIGNEFGLPEVDDPEPTTEPDDPEPTTEPDDPEPDDADAEAYLQYVRDDIDELDASIVRFFELLDTGADMTDAEFQEFIEIFTIRWGQFPDQEVPAGYEEIGDAHALIYTTLFEASINLAAFLSTEGGGTQQQIDDAIGAINSAIEQIAALDADLAALGF